MNFLVFFLKKEAILDNVKAGIKLNFDFYFPEGHLEIISGNDLLSTRFRIFPNT